MNDGHVYLSTACLHHDHSYCQRAFGYDVAGPYPKAPACCKWCDAPCICPCHHPVTEVDQP